MTKFLARFTIIGVLMSLGASSSFLVGWLISCSIRIRSVQEISGEALEHAVLINVVGVLFLVIVALSAVFLSIVYSSEICILVSTGKKRLVDIADFKNSKATTKPTEF